MGIEPTAGGCPATGFEVQERHQATNYSHVTKLNNYSYVKVLYCFSITRASFMTREIFNIYGAAYLLKLKQEIFQLNQGRIGYQNSALIL